MATHSIPPWCQFSRIARPGNLIFLISDFHELDKNTPQFFARLAQRSDVVALLVYDPMEATPPEPGRYPVTDGSAFSYLGHFTEWGTQGLP